MRTLTGFTGTITGYMVGSEADGSKYVGTYFFDQDVEDFTGTVWGEDGDWWIDGAEDEETDDEEIVDPLVDAGWTYDEFVFGDEDTVVKISGTWNGDAQSRLTESVNRALAEAGITNGDDSKLSDPRLLPVLKVIVDTANGPDLDLEAVLITDSVGRPLHRPAIQSLFVLD